MSKLLKSSNNTLIVIVLCCIGLLGCGSESSDSTEESSLSLTKGSVQLGPIKNSNIVISTLENARIVYTTNTDANGEFEINRNELNEVVSGLSEKTIFLKIVATGGTDIDPNDDGVYVSAENITLNGSVIWIVKTNDLLHKSHININLISTFFAEILSNYGTLNEAVIDKVLNNIEMYDINSDGKVSLDDVVDYQMQKDDSQIEET